jgi:hypothetical protein
MVYLFGGVEMLAEQDRTLVTSEKRIFRVIIESKFENTYYLLRYVVRQKPMHFRSLVTVSCCLAPQLHRDES